MKPTNFLTTSLMAATTAYLLYRKVTQPVPEYDYAYTERVSNNKQDEIPTKRDGVRHVLYFRCQQSPLFGSPPAEAMGSLPSRPETKDSEANPSLPTMEPMEGKKF